MAVLSAVSGIRGYYADMLIMCRISCCFSGYCSVKQAVRQESWAFLKILFFSACFMFIPWFLWGFPV